MGLENTFPDLQIVTVTETGNSKDGVMVCCEWLSKERARCYDSQNLSRQDWLGALFKTKSHQICISVSTATYHVHKWIDCSIDIAKKHT